jgi:hypothetical protein
MIAILLSTCDAYEAFAYFTFRQLNLHWDVHPQVFVSGLSCPSFAQVKHLPFSGDPRDWVGITLQAVTEIHKQGFPWLYLVLDDHPPLGPCNSNYLNRTMPKMAENIGAIQVNLIGWDQFQPQSGEALEAGQLHWQRNKQDFRWKFSLHPGLWHTETLMRLLKQLNPEVKTARAFEREADAACRIIDRAFCSKTYRIRGDGYTSGTRWYERRITRMAIRTLIHLGRVCTGAMGKTALEKLDQRLMPYLGYINGPYPIFWSGLLRQGRLHEDALRFLERTGRHAMAEEILRLPLPLSV